jgi:hypothetical protein
MPEPEFADALDLLARADVEFVVVEMASAILQGASMLTNNVDIVHRRSAENVARLLRVLTDLDAGMAGAMHEHACTGVQRARQDSNLRPSA